MSERIGGILQEISRCSSVNNSIHILESRADHIISSASNLLEAVRENCESEDEYNLLIKRFMSAIKNGDPSKFTRALRKQ